MKAASRPTLVALAIAFVGFALPGWLLAISQLSRTAPAENLSFELQNGSFSSLSWSIVQFKLLFSMRYAELLMRVQELQRTLPPSERMEVSARIGEMLEETLAEAQRAVPLESMQERLLWYYRAAGLTNGHAQTRSRIEGQMAPTEMLSTRRSEITDTPAGNP